MTTLTDDDTDAGAGLEPREGSSLYYSLLWTSEARRRRFLARLALVHTLTSTLEDVHEPDVAERKVHWWHEEIDRLASGAPRHPRTVACRDSLGALAAARQPCLDLLSVAAEARYTPPATEAMFRHALERGGRAALALLAHALSERTDDLAETADVRHPTLAHALALHAVLIRLPRLLHRGHAVFSDARYARHALTPADLARHVRRHEQHEPPPSPTPTSPTLTSPAPTSTLAGIPVHVDTSAARTALLAEMTDEADVSLNEALADPAYRQAYARPELAPLARLAALRARQLTLWRRTRPDLLRERRTPTPLAKLHIAWRHRHGPRRTPLQSRP